MSIVQFRQFVASGVAAIAIVFFCSDKKLKYIWFVLVTALAVLVHRSAFVVLLLLFWPALKVAGRKGRIIAVMALVGICVIAVMNAETLATLVFGELRTDLYFSASEGRTAISRMGGFRNVAFLVLVALCAYLCVHYMAQQSGHDGQSGGVFCWAVPEGAKVLMFLNICLLILVPVVFITNDFMRFERYGITYALALFAMMPMLKNRHVVLSCKALYVAICLLFAYFYVVNSFDSVYGALLSFEYLPAFFA